MSVLRRLDPLAYTDPSVATGMRVVTGFCLLFWGVLYLVPALLVAPWADSDSAMAVVEVYRRQWLVHGHPLQSSWLFGGGVLFRGVAQIPGWSPSVLLALVLGPKLAAVGWAWLQLGLGGGFAYGWARNEGANHRGAALVAMLGWCSLWLVRHLVDGHLAWPALAWVVAFGWLASARVSTLRTLLGGAVLALLLWSSSPLQAPFYGLPVLLFALTRGGLKRGAVLLVVLGLAVLPVLPLMADTFTAHGLYARDSTVALQDLKFLHGGSARLRNLLGLFVPFASYGFHAEGNLLALLPLLLSAGRPTRRVWGLAATLLLLGLAPSGAGIRQLERFWWALVLLASWHVAVNESRVSRRLVLLSLGFTTALSASLFALRALTLVEVPSVPSVPGLHGVAPVGEHYLANDDIEGGVYAAVRQGQVVHRPFSHVSFPSVPDASALVLEGEAVVQEGRLSLTLEPGQRAVVALRPEAAEWMRVPSDLSVVEQDGWLAFEAGSGGEYVVLAR
jgi:hypothetical protein